MFHHDVYDNDDNHYDDICTDCGCTTNNWVSCIHCLQTFCKPCIHSSYLLEAQVLYDSLPSTSVNIIRIDTYYCTGCNAKLRQMRMKYNEQTYDTRMVKQKKLIRNLYKVCTYKGV